MRRLGRPILGPAAVMGAGLIGLVSAAVPALALAGTVAVIVAAAALNSLTFGVVLITFLSFLETIPAYASQVTFVKLAGLIVAFTWIALALDRRGRIRLLFQDHPSFSYTVLLFVGWASASVIWATEPEVSRSYVIRLVLVAVLLYVTYSAIRTPRHLKIVLAAFVAGAFASTVYGITAGLSLGGDDRLVGGIGNPNDLAAVLVPTIVFSAVFAATARRLATRFASLVSLVVCVVAILMTQSRGGLVGLGVALSAALVVGGRLRPHALALLLIIASMGVTYYYAFATPTERTRLSNISAEGSSGRTDEWQIALEIAKDHPLAGVGMDNFRDVESRYVTTNLNLLQVQTVLKRPQPHNFYLQVLAELGIVGLVLLASILAGALVIGWRGVRRLAAIGDSTTELVGRGVIVAVTGFLAVGIFDNSLVKKELWLLLGLLVSLSAIARSETETLQDDTVALERR
jgi:O-antigen ligase